VVSDLSGFILLTFNIYSCHHVHDLTMRQCNVAPLLPVWGRRGFVASLICRLVTALWQESPPSQPSKKVSSQREKVTNDGGTWRGCSQPQHAVTFFFQWFLHRNKRDQRSREFRRVLINFIKSFIQKDPLHKQTNTESKSKNIYCNYNLYLLYVCYKVATTETMPMYLNRQFQIS